MAREGALDLSAVSWYASSRSNHLDATEGKSILQSLTEEAVKEKWVYDPVFNSRFTLCILH